MNSQNRRTASRFFAVSAALVLAFAPVLAEARAGKGSSSGSRGERSQSAPARTDTAPTGAQSFQRSNPAQSTPAASPARPGAPAAGAAAPAAGGMFSSPMARGIMGGLIGAGIVGLLMGSGLLNGLGSLAGIFGLLIQLALIGGLVWLAVAWWRRRQQPQMAAPMGYNRAAGPEPVDAGQQQQPQTSAPRSALGGLGGGMGGGMGGGLGGGLGALGGGAAAGGSAFGTPTRPLKVEGPDFERFEKLLEEVQGAYSQEDIGHLRRISTPEMAGYFEEDLAEQQAKGLISKSGGVKLLQGDLSEAWSEASGEYATVAMRYEIFDAVLERETGKVVSGDLKTPTEVTEIWTFLRPHNSGPQGWTLSAIQQVEEESPTTH
jgi:predicted lipid-binding transport protein (Tim44 family)